ncbi:hypothetical protein V6U71_21610 [Sphingopyxis sp. J-6]|uniref:hypothetical protein n=1 Tax=Sphingopyxis sp. J-6 TaxID=3122054 RepID=UPI003984088C
MTRGTPMHGRMKFAAETAVEQAGGVDGAAATTSRHRSTAGRWLNVNDPDLPTIDAAVALDKAAIAEGKAPAITAAMARDLRRVLIALPDVRADRGNWHAKAVTLTQEHGDLLTGLLRDLSDQKISKAEATKRRRDVADLIAIAVEIDLELAAIEEGE